MQVDLYDLFGHLMLCQEVDQTEAFGVDVSNLAAGMYLGVISIDGKQIARQKLTIIR